MNSIAVENQQLKKPRIHYGWVVLAASFLANASYGIFIIFSVFFRSLQTEFDWNRTVVSMIMTIHFLVTAFSTLIVGRLTDKYGPRKPLIGSAIAIGLGYGLVGQSRDLGQLYFSYIVASLGAGLMLPLPTTTVQRWFYKKRGLAMGLTTSGMSVAALILAPLVNMLIEQYGWRPASTFMGVIVSATVFLAAWLISPAPEQKGLRPYGMVETDSNINIAPGKNAAEQWTAKDAIRTRTFATFTAAWFFALFPLGLMWAHTISFATSLGITASDAATALGIIGAVNIAGRLIGPNLSERAGWKAAIFITLVIGLLSLAWTLRTVNLWMLYVFVVAYGLYGGAAMPVFPWALGNLFGTRALAAIIGTAHALAMIGCSLGPVLGGLIFDRLQSYKVAFVIGTASLALSILLVSLLKPPKRPARLGCKIICG